MMSIIRLLLYIGYHFRRYVQAWAFLKGNCSQLETQMPYEFEIFACFGNLQCMEKKVKKGNSNEKEKTQKTKGKKRKRKVMVLQGQMKE